jgi:DNA-binding transcriptional regulator GbsR (MarR family)
VSHQPVDRKDYYSPAGSFWDLAKTVFEQRKLREVDPTMSLLRDFLIDGDNEDSDEFVQQQIRELHDLLELLTSWGDQLNGLSADQLKRLMTLGSGVGKILDLKDKLVKVVSSDE